MAQAIEHAVADQKQALVLSGALQGQQALSLLGLPLLLVGLRTRTRPFSLARLTRDYSLAALVAGPAVGAAYAFAQTRAQSPAQVAAWAAQSKADRARQRREDYGVIGGAIGATALPALLLRRAPLLQLATAGFSLGTASGVLWHYASGAAVEGAPDAPVSGVGKGGLSGV